MGVGILRSPHDITDVKCFYVGTNLMYKLNQYRPCHNYQYLQRLNKIIINLMGQQKYSMLIVIKLTYDSI